MFRRSVRVVGLALVAVASFAVVGCYRRVSGAVAAPTGEGRAQGMRVYRDPVTGAFTEPPPGTAAAARSLTTPSALTEKAAPGGGTMVQLDGHFRSQFTAEVGSGRLAVTCATTAPRR